MKIFSLICHNGLGHYKRSVAVLHRLKTIRPAASITVACEGWQADRMKDWDVSSRFWAMDGVEHLDKLVAPGVRWEKNPARYSDGTLLEWHKKMQDLPQLQDADLVLSDNLPQVLHYRKDAVLLGSFLWSDILNQAYGEDKMVRAFVNEEIQLLQRHRPAMVCVGDMVMKSVEELTTAVKMPWFCDRDNTARGGHDKKIKLAFLGGATESINRTLTGLAAACSDQHIVYMPDALLKDMDLPGVRRFDFSPAAFRQLDCLVCRPGIGTLTEGVSFGIPIVAIEEPGNLEMSHNSKRVRELRMGTSLAMNENIAEMREQLEHFLHPANLEAAREKIRTLQCKGTEATVDWLMEHCINIR